MSGTDKQVFLLYPKLLCLVQHRDNLCPTTLIVLELPWRGTCATGGGFEAGFGFEVRPALCGAVGQEPLEISASWACPSFLWLWSCIFQGLQWHQGQQSTCRLGIRTLFMIRSQSAPSWSGLSVAEAGIKAPSARLCWLDSRSCWYAQMAFGHFIKDDDKYQRVIPGVLNTSLRHSADNKKKKRKRWCIWMLLVLQKTHF